MRKDVLETYTGLSARLFADGYDPYGGNCLDLAVGFAKAITSRGKHIKVVLLLRADENVPDEEILSHAILRNKQGDYDIGGDRAAYRWVRDFNMTQRANNEDEVEFIEEEYSENFTDLYETCLKRFNMNNASRELMEKTYADMRRVFN